MSFSYRAEKLHSAKKKSSLSFLEKNPFKFDSSSSEDEAEGGDEKTERKGKNVAADALKDEGGIGDFAQKLAEKTKSGVTGDSEPFFFTGAEDARLREAVRGRAGELHLLSLVDVGLMVHVGPQGRHLN